MAQVHQGHIRVTHIGHAVQFPGQLLDLIDNRVHIGRVHDGLLGTAIHPATYLPQDVTYAIGMSTRPATPLCPDLRPSGSGEW
jgi:hypothetical protein